MNKLFLTCIFGIGLSVDANPIGDRIDEVPCRVWVNTVNIDTGFEWCICMTEHEMFLAE